MLPNLSAPCVWAAAGWHLHRLAELGVPGTVPSFATHAFAMLEFALSTIDILLCADLGF